MRPRMTDDNALLYHSDISIHAIYNYGTNYISNFNKFIATASESKMSGNNTIDMISKSTNAGDLITPQPAAGQSTAYLLLDMQLLPTCDIKAMAYVLSGVVRIGSATNTSDAVNIMDENIDLAQYYQYLIIQDEAILGFWISISTALQCFYIDVSKVNFLHKKCAARLGALYTGNYRNYRTIQACSDWYSQFRHNDSDEETQHVTRIQLSKAQFKRECISREHHTLLRPEEALSAAYEHAMKTTSSSGKIQGIIVNSASKRCAVIGILINKAILLELDVEATIATFILYIQIADLFAVNLLGQILLNSSSPLQFREAIKAEGLWAKQLQHYIVNDLNYVFELNVLINRIQKTIDWEQEYRNRTTDAVTINIPASYVRNRARNIFAQAKHLGLKPKPADWVDYWAMRWALMPTGSFISQYDEDMIAKRKLPPMVANKTTVLSSIHDLSFDTLINRVPMIRASASIKYEWDKVRALYGCDITSYLMADFSMRDAEECLPPYFPVGASAKEGNVKVIMSRMNTGLPFCYDYDDFNSQHSFSSQTEVLKAWADVYKHDISDEQLDALRWTIASIQHQEVAFEHDKTVRTVASGLFSGWRHTAFMNTVLNRIYLLWAGLESKVSYAIHNGDDVYASLTYLKDGMELIDNAAKLGIRAQVTKMNIGTIAEFLRVDGMAYDSTGAQYLTRACTTAVHARIESEAAVTLKAGLDATRDRMESLIRRGGKQKVVLAIHKLITKNWARIFDTDYNTASLYYVTPLIQGGALDTREVQPWRILTTEVPNDDPKIESIAMMIDIGAQQYLNHIAKIYDLPVADVQREGIRRMNRAMLKGTKMTMRVVNEDRKYIKPYAAVYKAHAQLDVRIHIAKARLVGLFNIVLPSAQSTYLNNWLQRQKNPYQLMSIMI